MPDEFTHDITLDIKHEIVNDNASQPLEISAPKHESKKPKAEPAQELPQAPASESSALQPNIEFDLSEEPEF